MCYWANVNYISENATICSWSPPHLLGYLTGLVDRLADIEPYGYKEGWLWQGKVKVKVKVPHPIQGTQAGVLLSLT